MHRFQSEFTKPPQTNSFIMVHNSKYLRPESVICDNLMCTHVRHRHILPVSQTVGFVCFCLDYSAPLWKPNFSAQKAPPECRILHLHFPKFFTGDTLNPRGAERTTPFYMPFQHGLCITVLHFLKDYRHTSCRNCCSLIQAIQSSITDLIFSLSSIRPAISVVFFHAVHDLKRLPTPALQAPRQQVNCATFSNHKIG